MGHPLQGDPLYAAGGSVLAAELATDNAATMPGGTGYSLHSWQLQLRHPITGL